MQNEETTAAETVKQKPAQLASRAALNHFVEVEVP